MPPSYIMKGVISKRREVTREKNIYNITNNLDTISGIYNSRFSMVK